MSEVSDHKQDDLLTEYGTTTTAYLLMAMSIDSLERKNKQLEDENAKLRELCADLHILCYPQSYEWEVTDHTYEKYSPCELCEKAHGGKSPCASTSEDLTEECCKPFQAKVVADRIRELGIEVPE